VDFNEQGFAIGKGQSYLARFLGTLELIASCFLLIMIGGLDLPVSLKFILMIALKHF